MKYTKRNAKLMNIVSAVSFLIALILNGLANILPINGLETGVISDTYANYFAPIGLTFSIWAVIYTVLAIYVGWRLKHIQDNVETPMNRHLFKIDIAFTISSLANAGWILAWHYLQFPLSLVLMLILFASLVYINLTFRGDLGLTTIPFRIYFGWITVATVANVTTMIVADANSYRWIWNGGEVSQQILTTIILVITILIGVLTTIRQRDAYYGAVIVWALFGIFLRHTVNLPSFGINGIANTALIGVILAFFAMLWTLRKKILKLIKKS